MNKYVLMSILFVLSFSFYGCDNNQYKENMIKSNSEFIAKEDIRIDNREDINSPATKLYVIKDSKYNIEYIIITVHSGGVSIHQRLKN
jgi:hypothetical protein